MAAENVTLEEAVQRAARSFIEIYREEELDYFDLLWNAARRHLGDLVQAETSISDLVPDVIGVAEPSKDWVSPTVLMVFAILFTKLPLTQYEMISDEQIKEEVLEAAKRCGAQEQLTRHLIEVAPSLYRLPVTTLRQVIAHEELYQVWIRHKGESKASLCPKTWEQLQTLRKEKSDFDLFVDLERRGPVYYDGTPIRELEPRHKELLAYILLRFGQPCTMEDIWEQVWLKRPDYYGAAKLEDEERKRHRIDKAARTLVSVLHGVRAHIAITYSSAKGTLRYEGKESFCVIPEKPTVRLQE